MRGYPVVMLLALICAPRVLAADADSLAQTAMADNALGRYEKAASEYRQALGARPDDYGLRMALAEVYVRQGRLEDARREFSAARRLRPRAADAYIQQGYADLNSGDREQARLDFEQLIAVDTASPIGYIHMGSFLFDDGRYDQAERLFRRALALLDEKKDVADALHARLWLGETLQYEGRRPEAEASFLETLRSAPSDPRERAAFEHALGSLYLQQGRLPEAQERLERAASACPGVPQCPQLTSGLVQSELARLFLSERRPDEARLWADRAWKIMQALWDTASEGPILPALDDLGYVYEALGQPADAEKAYRRIVASGPAMKGVPFIAAAERRLEELSVKAGRPVKPRPRPPAQAQTSGMEGE